MNYDSCLTITTYVKPFLLFRILYSDWLVRLFLSHCSNHTQTLIRPSSKLDRVYKHKKKDIAIVLITQTVFDIQHII